VQGVLSGRTIPSPSPHVSAALVMLGASLLLHLPAIALGLTPLQDDVRVFYFPLLVATADALKQGTLPLWTPNLFGGYALFADGEAGMLYPLHLLVLPWLTPESALVVLHVFHTAAAGIFCYALLRSLGAGTMGGIAGGLCYGLSSFAAGQVVHDNVFNALPWLPLELAFIVRACRAGRLATGARYAMLAGGAFGIQALALHVYVTMLSALTVVAFVGYWAITSSRPSPDSEAKLPPDEVIRNEPRAVVRRWVGWRFRAVATAGLCLFVVGTVGVGLGAVQLFPLAELGGQSSRAAGLDGLEAVMNSTRAENFATLLLPRLFDTPASGYWGPWVKWETILYVGIAPLLLAVVGLLFGGRFRLFFGALVITAVLVSLGNNGPVPLWDLIHRVPGFDVLRSPGRFALLSSLGVAVLCGYGVDRLMRLRTGRPRWAAVCAVATGAAGWLAWQALDSLSQRLVQPDAILLQIVRAYLAAPGVPEVVDRAPLTGERILSLAASALTPEQPATAWQLWLLIASGLVLSLWLAGPRLRHLAAVCTTILIISDLWVAGLTLHPYGHIASLRAQVPAVLRTQTPGPPAPYRIFTQPTADEKSTQFEPNRLLGVGIEEATGYSSIQPLRHAAYLHAAEYTRNDLLDLWNVRFLVLRNPRPALPSYGGTSFHPEQPLFSGRLGTPGSSGTLLPDGGPATVDEVQVVGTLWDARSLPPGTIAARINLTNAEGAVRSVDLRIGRDIADARANLPNSSVAADHANLEVAYQFTRSDPTAYRYGEQFYYARRPLRAPFLTTAVSVENLVPGAGLEIYGVGLFDAATGEITQARDKERLQPVYRDDQVRIYENMGVLPRAFLVPSAMVGASGPEVLSRMLDGPFNPRETVFVECAPPDTQCGLPPSVTKVNPARLEAPGIAAYRSYESDASTIQVTAIRDSMLVISDRFAPGWFALVDDQPAPILRGNYLFRAIHVPAGLHSVRLIYAPWSLGVGAALSAFTILCVFVATSVHAVTTMRRRWAPPAWLPRRRPSETAALPELS
jgi:hypothetical protein